MPASVRSVPAQPPSTGRSPFAGPTPADLCAHPSITRHTADHLIHLSERDMQACTTAIRAAIVGGSHIYTLGNGGSATTASHLACDLTHRRRAIDGRRARVRCLYDLATTTAVANDHGYDQIFSAPLSDLVEPGDVVMAISVSGASPNVVRALELGRARGVVNVSLLGCDGGAALALSDLSLHVSCRDPGVVESVHLAVVHELAVRVFQVPAGTGGSGSVAC